MFTLRPYQESGIERIREMYRSGKRNVLYVLPTAGGKTLVFTFVISGAYNKGNRCLVLVHRVELVKQTHLKLSQMGIPHGVIHPDYRPDYKAQIQVASVDTLVGKLDIYPDFDLIVIDEAHHTPAGTWDKIVTRYSSAKRLGVTATPIRTDGQGLDGMFDCMVVGPQISELIEHGYLVKPELYYPPVEVDLSALKTTRKGDFSEKQMEKLLSNKTIIGNAVAEYTKICPGVPAVVFCVSVNHAEAVNRQFVEAGYKSYVLTGKTESVKRDAIIEGLGNGAVQVVCSVNVISEGTDIPDIGCVINLRPTASLSLYLQQGGRGLRSNPAKGKTHCVVLDHVLNFKRHGLLEQEREWSLEGMKKKKRGKADDTYIQVVQCPKCYYVYQSGASCPKCGCERQIKERKIEEAEGQLVKMSDEEKERLKKQRKNEVYNARTEAELMEIAKKKGYKPSWVKYIMKARADKMMRK